MTLSTNVYVLDEVDPHEVFRFCQGMLAQYDDAKRTPDEQVWTDEADSVYLDGEWVKDPGRRRVANKAGQNLPGILGVDYRVGGPLREAQTECDEDCDSDECSGRYHDRACWLDVDFDTAYSAVSSGLGCGQLHAALVTELGQWLDAKGVRWEWRNEYTGDVHGGEDRYERLVDLLSGSAAATAWFHNTVLPTIAAEILATDTTEIPECICPDSNLPARKDCPHCYPGGAR